MSDYLNTLVARTLRLGPVVQPRLASLFEPVPAGPANDQRPEVFESRALEETARRRPAAELSELPGLSELPREKNALDTESRATNEPRAGVVLQSQPMRQTFLPVPVTPPSPFSINDTGHIREVRDEESAPPSAGTETITTSTETHSNPTPSRIKPEVRIISTATDRGQIQPLLSMPAHAAPPHPLLSGRKAGTEVSIPAEAPEAVVVTIGRVDVRAVFPSSPAAPPANRVQQQQAMSLDEYLKQRSEGRR